MSYRPNGAGKTTLVKMMVGLLAPTRGTITLFDNDIVKEPEIGKQVFGYISDDPSVYEYLTPVVFPSL